MVRRTDDTLRCSFCGKSQNEVKKLIAGPTVYICNKCIDICNEIITDDQQAESVATRPPLPKPGEIKNFLDEYVIGQEETKKRLAEAAPKSVADIRALGRPVVGFSPAMTATDRTIKAFLYKRMYEHWHLNRSHSKARRVVMDLFGLLFAEPNCLPPPWRERAEAAERPARARIVADYIAGMTDRFALDEHRRLFDLYQ